METLIFIVLAVVVVALLWNRLIPIDRDRWHADPAETEDEDSFGLHVIGRESPRYPSDPSTVLGEFAVIANEEPGTRRLEGDVDEGMMTFVTRIGLFGRPEFTTAKVADEGNETKLSIAVRRKKGLLGGGVDAHRLDRWLQDMRLRLGE